MDENKPGVSAPSAPSAPAPPPPAAPPPTTLPTAAAVLEADAAAKRVKELEAQLAEIQAQTKTLGERAAKADEYERAAKERDEAEAAKRGEYERLYGEAKTALDAERDAHEETKRGHQRARMREALDNAYEKVGGVDVELFRLLTDKYIEDGTVKVGDSGAVVGVAAVVKKIAEAKPPLFKDGTKEVLAKFTDPGGGTPAPLAAFDLRDTKAKGYAGSLANPNLSPAEMQRIGWRKLN